MKRDLPQDNLARNLRFLMEKHDHKPADLAAKLKGRVGKTTLHYILNREKVAKIDTAHHIASVYGLSGWNLISPTLIEDMAKPGTLSRLIDNYTKADAEGRKHIEQVAEREAQYTRPAKN